MKTIKYLMLIGLMFALNLQLSNASCKNVKYYSVENYIKHYNLIDVDKSAGSIGFFNSENIFVKINALGNYDNPNSISNANITNKDNSIIVKETSIADPIYMYIEFDETIKISEIILDIDAVNTKTNKPVKKSIYLNGYKSREVEGSAVLTTNYGSLIKETKSNDLLKINTNNQEVNSILIEFEYNVSNEYQLNYFQISEYSIMEHVGWSSEYIEGTNIKNTVICEGTGNYLTDGTNEKWYQSYATSFSPSINIVSDYIPKRTSFYAIAYDSQNNGSLTYGATPADIKGLFNDYSSIKNWTSTGNLPRKNFYSNGYDTEFIMTSKNEGYKYLVRPYYWDNVNVNYVHHITSSYCKIFTHQNVSTCYKHYGHTINSLTNYFDVYIDKYTNITPVEYRKIDNVKYYLCDEDNKCKFLKETKDEITNINFTKSGKYKINAIITDMYGNVNNKYSKYFLIDNEVPIVNFDGKIDDFLNIDINVSDSLSGIQKYCYQISKDGGLTYSDKSEWYYSSNLNLKYYSNGLYKVKVEAIDNASNSKIYVSNNYDLVVSDYNISDAYGFSYDINEDSYLHFKVKCEGCNKKEEFEINVYQNDKLIKKFTTNLLDSLDNVVTYKGSENKTDFKIIIIENDLDKSNNVLNITTYEKTKNIMSTDQQLIEFQEKVCSMVNSGLNQVDYNENIQLSIIQNKLNYMAGEGIDIKVNYNYNNSCKLVENYKCVSSNAFYGDLIISFNDGIDSLKSKYYKNGQYLIHLNKENNYFLLDKMYVDEQSGDVYNAKNNDDLIDGGNKWYTNFNSELKSYDYKINGENIGYNNCSFEYFGKYILNKNYVDEIKVRFVDIDNPFPNKKSEIWSSSNFFNNLKNTNVLYTEELFSD